MTSSEMSKVAQSILTRVYEAPKQFVFNAWTKVEHLQKWMFPQKGFTCDYVTADIRPGGTSLHKMTTVTGHQVRSFFLIMNLCQAQKFTFQTVR